ncbi:hypothetical protein [Methylorubrum extorquens]|uniref:hypothetical protein n=1 Tax=Methylorubrum extorquens TaxID=408 RepID=UPI001300FB6D|nr:hypothetical protein [Methylorubrum extorquens]MCP1542462.1 hypothetical protein [Methylorubrum extorquens]MCP1590193.1 hypothetical protein [Methylorubrum extorquens]
MSKQSRYDLGAIMRRSWVLAREVATAIGEGARAHLAGAMRRAWADAKAAVAQETEEARLKPGDLIGHEEAYLGGLLKYVSIKPWSSKDGYDKRDYIVCEFNGRLKDKNLMYFHRSGQVDLFHIEVDTPYGKIWCHDNIEADFLA